MKLRVVGWVYYDDDLEEGEIGWAARNAVEDEIKRRGYLFTGWSHQEGYLCAPVLNDGKIRRFSQRGWGSVMAAAHGHTDRMDYARYTFCGDIENEIRPEEYFDSDGFIPENDLNEKFEIEVEEEVFASADGGEIKLDDLPQLRYLDSGDTLVLHCAEKRADFKVADVDRERDLTEDERWKLELDFYAFDDKERMKRAERIFNGTKIVMKVKINKAKKI